MIQFGHDLLKITDAAVMPRHAKLLVTDGITRGNDEVRAGRRLRPLQSRPWAFAGD
mgnify:CR=1 FL=1